MQTRCSFFGSATVGSKGQIVIPQEAREQLGIKTGDKLVVLGLKGNTMLGVCSVEGIETFLGDVTDHLTSIRNEISKAKEED
ncbi:MAG TPA: AbrB/MazE/SpoVT family DNA-binding domain-containing protein [Candidatus Saccharimonadales bacterium]|nr:AbrB/MazE/SpoVT family DNA-binding domain-containing protein [Candidatus Saccharimonadales bacterium]